MCMLTQYMHEHARTMMVMMMLHSEAGWCALTSDSSLASHIYSIPTKQLATWLFTHCPQLPLQGLAMTSN